MPLRFSDALRTVRLLPALAAVLWPGPGSCARAEWRLAIGHVAGRARDTHLWFLFERDERMAAAQPALEPSVRATFQRTVAHLRVMRQGFLWPGVPLPASVNGRRATWPVSGHRVRLTLCHADSEHVTVDRQRSWGLGALRRFGPTSARGADVSVRSRTPRARLPSAHHFPTVFVGAAVAVPGVAAKRVAAQPWTRRSRRWRLVALPGSCVCS